MSERDPHRWARFAASIVSLLAVGVAVPLGLIAVSRSRFGSANPLAGADPPWRWGSGPAGDALSRPISDDTVIDGIIRLSLCVVWIAVAVIVITTIVEVVHVVRHHGLTLPAVRGVGWAQPIARFIAVGIVAVLPVVTPTTSLASTLGARPVAGSTFSDTATAVPTSATAGRSTGASAVDSVQAAPAAPTEAAGSVHVVATGESIYAIAVELAGGDSALVLDIADAIIDANLGTVMSSGQRFTNPAYIEVGWTLRIPAGVARSVWPDDVAASTTAANATADITDAGDADATYVV